MAIWGTPAAGGSYAAIAALTNIPATILAASFHEFILADSSRGTCSPPPRTLPVLTLSASVVTPPHVDHMVGHLAHAEHSGLGPALPAPKAKSGAHAAHSNSSYASNEKGEVEAIERV